MEVIAALFDVLSFAAAIVLVVLGLGIIANMMGIFNFAHGEFVLLGAYVTWLASSWGYSAWAGILAAPILLALFGALLELTVIRRFYAAPIVAMLATYALSLIIRESVRSLIGGLYYSVPEPLPGSFVIGAVSLSRWRMVVILITIIVMLSCYLLLTRTSVGLKVRASLENPALARASGLSTSRIYAMTFAFGAALAGLAGALIVPIFALSADLGIRFLIQGFVAVMLGGVGSFEGPLVGAGVIGISSAALPWAVPPVLADVLVFVLAIVFIKFRPGGLLARRV
ncbi:amino acid/amide ABC transporter membrane protein 1, HAAT family [Rhizobiales bacterium GAS191]|jgi:branched-chain amino acid transport system permease protein|nr:amino acid/amide ABC transporter membrane protein 1, HAAT family [Rhizobiales bacterium GAS113]SED95719.1 amino acid/amide ABC transporter membrane protein 1, HAAT family [Rhizobiales bacterium GAS188]SEE56423.1 amino acid/amide ABC transporter membrane protein 1, HAAT family [Rhizobiales bacterium GAS191]